MGIELSSAEHAALSALEGVYPRKLNLHELAGKILPALERSDLLLAVKGLYSRKLLECKPLESTEGLVDAANIIVSPEGIRFLKESGFGVEAPAVVKVLNVLISSPSDVRAESVAVENAIQEWNTNHYMKMGIMLHPVRWETHSYPAIGDRPQGILNKQIVRSAHFLIGIFGNRLGTPTGNAPSGTIEEIEEIRKTGRHVALYFSNAPVPRDVDRAQLEALEKYQHSLKQQGLYFSFRSIDELRRLVTQHLPKIVDEVNANIRNDELAVKPQRQDKPLQSLIRRQVSSHLGSGDLIPKEMELLWTATKASDGQIYHSSTLEGGGIRTNGQQFMEKADARTASEWQSALRIYLPKEKPVHDSKRRIGGDAFAKDEGLGREKRGFEKLRFREHAFGAEDAFAPAE